MPVTLLDLIIVAVVLISAALAMIRGFTREILSIAAWLAAAVAAIYLHHHVVPYLTPYIKNATAAQLAAGAIVFLVTLIIVSFITVRISDSILDSSIGALDRTLGFLFGAVRGVLLAAVAFAFFGWLVSEATQPAWVREAKSKPYLLQLSDWLFKLLPENLENEILKRLHSPSAPGPDASTPEAEEAPAAGPAPEAAPPPPVPAPGEPPAQPN